MLRLLGTIECSDPGTGQVLRLGQKPQALLALIAAHGSRGVRRERAISLLWGEKDDLSAAAAMRQCLHHLRQALAGASVAIDGDRDHVVLSSAPIDVWEFVELATRNDLADLDRAARLFRGDFAEGLQADYEEFAHWLSAEQLRLRAIACDVVARLAQLHIGPDTTAAGIALARRLIASDPLHEGCHRALMRMLAHGGMRAEALRVYEECRRTLRAEIDVGPSTETVALAAQIRNGNTPGPGAASTVEPVSPSETSASSSVARTVRRQVHPVATDRLLRAWQLFSQFTLETNFRARVELEAVVGIDPANDGALALLGWTHFFDYINSWTDNSEESYQRACVQVDRALVLGSGQPSPHSLRAKLLLWKLRHDEALQQANTAIEIAPTYAHAHFHLADVLVHCGLHDEGLRHIRIAMELDPVDYGMFRTIEALALFLTEELQGALRSAESALIRNPNYAWAHWLLAATHAKLGNYEAARAAAACARDVNPGLQARFGGAYTPLRLEPDRARLVQALACVDVTSRGALETPGIAHVRPAG